MLWRTFKSNIVRSGTIEHEVSPGSTCAAPHTSPPWSARSLHSLAAVSNI